MKMAKIDLPALTGDLDAANVTSWLNLCKDSFEAWSAMNSDKVVKVSLQVLLAGLKMESPPAKHWWNENRDDLKLVTSWNVFAQRVKDRFVPPNWHMNALAKFYSISQGTSPFTDFVTNLQNARNALASSGSGFTVNDSIIKNHLLFFCHPILSLRIRSIPDFRYGDTKLDTLIGLMTSAWDTMIAEHLVRPALSSSHSLATSSAATKPSGSRSQASLSDSEREALKLAGACFRCRKSPASRGWIPHSSRNCPGDPANGISPAAGAGATIGTVMLHQAEEQHIAAILLSMSSFVLEGNEYEDLDSSDSDGSD
jgi:hypothetical protein